MDFPYIFPSKLSFFTHKFLHLLFKHIDIEKGFSERLKTISKEGVIVYVAKYASYFDLILYHYCLREARLPYPRLFFDINLTPYIPISDLGKLIASYSKSLIKNRRFPSPYEAGFYDKAIQERLTSMLFLINPGKFSQYFVGKKPDPLDYLIKIQKKLSFPIYLVPILIFYKTSPEKYPSWISKLFFSYRDKPGFITKIALFFKQHRKALIDIGEPINLESYIQGHSSKDKLLYHLKNELIDIIDRHKRAVLGPVVKSKAQIKEMVLRDERIQEVIYKMAKNDKKKIKELKKKAEEYFEEIAADYSISYTLIFYKFLTWFWKKIFHSIDVSESDFSLIRNWAKKGYPIVYVPSHKSHIDYLVLNYLLFDHHIHPPRIAAGKNLAFWPMGHIFRKCGAFFIRRSFKGAKLYTFVFERYIKFLLQEGYPIEFFIEGGRSRSGKLEFPKTGFLSILVDAWKEGYCKDIVFIPVSITYDTVVEEGSYVKEMKGLEKEPESFTQLLKAKAVLQKKYGKIYVRFAKPILLSEYADKTKEVELTNSLSFYLVRSINKMIPVTPISLISVPIMTKLRNGFYIHELEEACKATLDLLMHRNAPLSIPQINEISNVVKNAVSHLLEKDILLKIKNNHGFDNFLLCLNEKKSLELSYYKNTIIHFFIPYSFVGISLISSQNESKSIAQVKKDYMLLRELFKYEFIYEKEAEEEIEEAVSYFYEKGFLTYENNGFHLTVKGRKNIIMWAELLRNYIEAYWIATRIFKARKKRIKEKDLLKKMKLEGEKLYSLNVVKHSDSISYPIFRNALKYVKEKTSFEDISHLSQWLYSLLQELM